MNQQAVWAEELDYLDFSMKTMKFRTFRQAKKTAQHILSQAGTLDPVAMTAVAHLPEALQQQAKDIGVAVIGLPGDKERQRQALAFMAQSMPWFVTVQEVWFAPYVKGELRAPSERPDRKEAIMLLLIENGQTTRMAQCPFRRGNDGAIYFEDWIQPKGKMKLCHTAQGVCGGIKNSDGSDPVDLDKVGLDAIARV
jgi:hypothetical protein